MNLSTTVPQLFYDLIGRIIPGLAVLVMAIYILNGHDNFISSVKSSSDMSFAFSVGIILISYLIGTIVGGMWLFFVRRKTDKKLENELLEISNQFPSGNIIETSKLNIIGLVYDYVHHADPAAGVRIAKLSAEQHMAGVIILGGLFGGILNLFVGKDSDYMLSVYCVIFSICSFFLYQHLKSRFATSLKNHWKLSQEVALISQAEKK